MEINDKFLSTLVRSCVKVGPSVSKYFVYALLDPRFAPSDARAWRYIGKSTKGFRRPKSHGSPSYLRQDDKVNPEKASWLRELISLNLSYVVRVLSELPEPAKSADESERVSCGIDLAIRERELIAEARALGLPLLNKSEGGEVISGSMLGKHHSDSTRRKMSESRTGLRHSEESRAKMSVSARNRSPETRARISEAQRSRPAISDETRRRMSRAAKARGGRPHSPTSREKMSRLALVRERNKRS